MAFAEETNMNKEHILIHSLFRAGSTYFFNVFRRAGAGYYCYQEPLHELALYARNNQDLLFSDHGDEKANFLRHPKLDLPYFQELHDVAEQCLPYLDKSNIYDAYFSKEGSKGGAEYLRKLISEAKGRAVIQECRSSSRIGMLKQELAGFHIYLWRNPWDQWWSYKVASYFDTANQLIINANPHPDVISRLRREIGLEDFQSERIDAQFDWYLKNPLSSENSFLVFYILWFLGLQEGKANADLLVNIDRLSDNLEYRQTILESFARNNILGLALDDCRIHQSVYGDEDRKFFTAIEDKAHGLLLLSGIPQRAIDGVVAMRKEFEPSIQRNEGASASTAELIRDAERARALALQSHNNAVIQCVKYNQLAIAEANLRIIADEKSAIASEAEARALQAETKARDAEERIIHADSRALDAEARATHAESRAQDAESRIALAERKIEDAEARVEQAEARVHDAEARVEHAEGRAHDAELRVAQAESKAQDAEARTMRAETVAREAEICAALPKEPDERIIQAEARAQDAESRVLQSEENIQHAMSYAKKIEEDAQRLEALLQQSMQETYDMHERIVRLHQSTSWRITRPLRMFKKILTGDLTVWVRIKSAPLNLMKAMLKPVILGAIRLVMARPALRAPANRFLRSRFPRLQSRLRSLLGAQITKDSHIFKFATTASGTGLYTGKKVAILAPGSSSGVVGGAERFYSGLQKALQNQGCDTELILITVDETTFEGIQKGYQDFAKLDLASFDLVISTKAPTYVANHPNHVLYLVHTIRVFYDMFDEVFPHADAARLAQREWVHEQDNAALDRIQHRFSIGSEVSDRLIKWNDCSAEVLHPPVDVDGLYDLGIGDYFYMPGRLHAWKRVDLAIKAIKCSSLPLKLVISGTGDAESQLRELAGNDPRIEFLGRVDDETLKRLYAGALAVPFLPISEDYGYITLEAFASGKPVITCADSGEPTVFVEDGVSGLVCTPEPRAICAAFEQLWNNRQLAERMGQAGRDRVASISWELVAGRLLQAGFPDIVARPIITKEKLKVAVLDMQPIMPAVGGGRLRLLGLYHALGADIQVRYVGTYDWPGEKYRRHFITPSLEEIDVPLSTAHHEAAADAAAKAGGKTVIDMLFPRQAHLSPEYLQEIFDSVKWAEVVVFSHPWLAPLVSEDLLEGKTVIYDAQNVESDLRAQLLDLSNPFEQDVLNEVVRAEELVGERADIVLACSKEDIEGFHTRFGWPRNQLRLVPNGVFSERIQPASAEQKIEARNQLGAAEGAFIGFFIGSNYAPNIEAAHFIIEQLAAELPDVLFIIGGGVCSQIPAKLPTNVRSIGFLEEQDKIRWLHASDFAINPMFSGSGTNIKMFDFMSAGLPVVTTQVGARGIANSSTAGLYLAERDGLAEVVRRLLTSREHALSTGQENRRIVEEKFAWEAISPELGRTIRSTHFRKQGTALLNSPDAASIRVAHLSTAGLTCGIGEYTRKIIDSYQRHGVSNFLLTARAANEEPDLASLNIPSCIAWYFDNNEWRSSHIMPHALQSMLDWGATHLIVQYHHGFLPPEALFEFVIQAKNHGIGVTVVVHNFTENVAVAFRHLNELGITLFSHRMTEVSQARALGVLLDQVPLGLEVFGSALARTVIKRDWAQQPPIIVTTGFLRKHKGIATLIRTLPEVLKHYPGVKLIIQCALYPSADSERELETCKKEVKRLRLQDSVTIDTRFLDKEVVYAVLAKADIAILPYEQSNEGGSATATDCMAVGLPLIVSDAEIFDEIRDVVLTAKPNEQNMADAILKVLWDSELYESLASRSSAYARANSWDSVTGAFLSATTIQGSKDA